MAMDLDEPLAAENFEAALQRLRDADPSVYLSPSADLAAAARAALKHLHSSLAVVSPVQPPLLPDLLAGPNFDAEQIWSQSELLSRPLLPHLHRQLRRLKHQPPSHPSPAPLPSKPAEAKEEPSDEEEGDESEDLDEDELEGTDDELDSGEGEEEEETEKVQGRTGDGVEDDFLKVKELEDFLAIAEEQEYGGSSGGEKKKATVNWAEDDSDEEDMDEDDGGDEEEDDDDLDMEDFDDDDDDDDDDEENAVKSGRDIWYKDFFEESHKQQVKKTNSSTKKVHFKDELHEMKQDDTENDDVNDAPTLEDVQGLSTHEKERLKMRAKIEQMEKANLEPGHCFQQAHK